MFILSRPPCNIIFLYYSISSTPLTCLASVYSFDDNYYNYDDPIMIPENVPFAFPSLTTSMVHLLHTMTVDPLEQPKKQAPAVANDYYPEYKYDEAPTINTKPPKSSSNELPLKKIKECDPNGLGIPSPECKEDKKADKKNSSSSSISDCEQCKKKKERNCQHVCLLSPGPPDLEENLKIKVTKTIKVADEDGEKEGSGSRSKVDNNYK